MSFTVHWYNYYSRHVLQLCLGVIVAATVSQGNAVFKENELAAIPTFMIIGAAKGGTTDLYYQLVNATSNLEVTRPDPPLLSVKKEIRMLQQPMDSEELLFGSKTMMEYLEVINHPCAPEKELHRLQICLASQPRQYTIDASPIYMNSPFAPLNLRPISLDTKILLLLRDPLETLESLYVHRVVKEGRWSNTTLNTLTANFFGFLQADTTRQQTFEALAACGDTACQERGWRDLAAMGLLHTIELRLVTNILYVYSLAAWRRHYFQPGRVMVIDSHAYYRDRVAVMEQVIRFLYGREMNGAERDVAENAVPQNTHQQSAKRHPITHELNLTLLPNIRKKVEELIRKHVHQRLPQTLVEMKEEGAWIVGFDSSPWPWAPGPTK